MPSCKSVPSTAVFGFMDQRSFCAPGYQRPFRSKIGRRPADAFAKGPLPGCACWRHRAGARAARRPPSHLISPHCFSLFQESFSSFLPEGNPSPVSVPHPCGQCDRREITPSVDKESGLWGDERTNAGPCEKSNLSMLSKTDTSAHTSKKGKFAHTSFPIGKGDRAQSIAVQCSPAHLSAVQGSQ